MTVMRSLFDNTMRECAVEYGIAVKSRNESFVSAPVTSSAMAADYLRPLFGADIEIVESFVILVMSRSNKIVGWAKVSTGGRTATVVDVSIIAKIAVDSLACGVILAHNHPSGSLRPSAADDSLTSKIKQGLALLDVKALDHIILSPDGNYYSYSDEGRL